MTAKVKPINHLSLRSVSAFLEFHLDSNRIETSFISRSLTHPLKSAPAKLLLGRTIYPLLTFSILILTFLIL